MKNKTKLLRMAMLCMGMVFSATEMWAGTTTHTMTVKCAPTGAAKVYVKRNNESTWTSQSGETASRDQSVNLGSPAYFDLKYDNKSDGYQFLGWYYDSEFTKEVNEEDIVGSKTNNIYAKYLANTDTSFENEKIAYSINVSSSLLDLKIKSIIVVPLVKNISRLFKLIILFMKGGTKNGRKTSNRISNDYINDIN